MSLCCIISIYIKIIAEIKAKGLNASALEDSGRWEYREPYRIMYACFDKYMEEKLNEVGASLASLGLGLEASKKKKSGKSIIIFMMLTFLSKISLDMFL